MTLINPKLHTVTAFAPATCANLAVGFDILGLAFEELGDYLTLTKRQDSLLVIEALHSKEELPLEITRNTAGVALQAMRDQLGLKQGFSIHIQKGIPLSGGLGGSAASAVAAVVACNAFLTNPLTPLELAQYALLGEEAASGQKHADNVAPCIFGGLTLVQEINPLKILQLPIPPLFCVLIHPHLKISTKAARKILQPKLSLNDHIKQSAYLATFIASLYQNDFQLLQASFKDLLIEPQRASLVPGFYQLKQAALEAGALGFSFSGSGPSLLALSADKEKAKIIAEAMQNQLKKENLASDYWLAPISQQGARITALK